MFWQLSKVQQHLTLHYWKNGLPLFVFLPSTYIPKLYIPSTLNIDLILCYTQLIVFAENVKSWFKSWVFPFTFQAYILPHTLNCMCVSLFKFHI